MYLKLSRTIAEKFEMRWKIKIISKYIKEISENSKAIHPEITLTASDQDNKYLYSFQYSISNQYIHQEHSAKVVGTSNNYISTELNKYSSPGRQLKPQDDREKKINNSIKNVNVRQIQKQNTLHFLSALMNHI